MTVDELVKSFTAWKCVCNVRVTYKGYTVMLTTETLKRWFGNKSVASFDADFVVLDDERIYPRILYPNDLQKFAEISSFNSEEKEK